jgi:hypothetical protein
MLSRIAMRASTLAAVWGNQGRKMRRNDVPGRLLHFPPGSFDAHRTSDRVPRGRYDGDQAKLSRPQRTGA